SGRPPSARPWRTSASMEARKAVSVLPEPVGAATRVLRPDWIGGHAARWASVGPPGKVARNQPAAAGWKASSGSCERAAPSSRAAREEEAGIIPPPYFR